MPKNKEESLKLFSDRITAQSQAENEVLAKLVSPPQKEKLFGFLLDKSTVWEISKLDPGEAMAFGRPGKQFDADADLPIKLVVFCSYEGDYIALLDHKSKRVEGKTEEDTRILVGTSKTKGKLAYRLDQPEIWFAANELMPNKTANLLKAKKEAEYSQQLPSEHFNALYLGPYNRKKQSMTFYSLKAEYDLRDFLAQKNIVSDKIEFHPLSENEFEMMSNLFKGVEHLHEKKWVHHDLKSSNVLFSFNEKRHPQLKITDFSTLQDFSSVNKERAFHLGAQLDMKGVGKILFELIYRRPLPAKLTTEMAEEIKKYPLLYKILNPQETTEPFTAKAAASLFLANKEIYTEGTPAPDKDEKSAFRPR